LEFASKESKDLRSNFFADAPKVSPFQSLEELAAQAGKTVETLKSEDSHHKPDTHSNKGISQEPIDLIPESLNNDLMESLLDMDDVEDDEIVYLDDSELEDLKMQGFVFEEVDDEGLEEE